jgi:hypothetical protein
LRASCLVTFSLIYQNCIFDVMVSVFTLSVVDGGFVPRSGTSTLSVIDGGFVPRSGTSTLSVVDGRFVPRSGSSKD